jgi:hypothetical protein
MLACAPAKRLAPPWSPPTSMTTAVPTGRGGSTWSCPELPGGRQPPPRPRPSAQLMPGSPDRPCQQGRPHVCKHDSGGASWSCLGRTLCPECAETEARRGPSQVCCSVRTGARAPEAAMRCLAALLRCFSALRNSGAPIAWNHWVLLTTSQPPRACNSIAPLGSINHLPGSPPNWEAPALDAPCSRILCQSVQALFWGASTHCGVSPILRAGAAPFAAHKCRA